MIKKNKVKTKTLQETQLENFVKLIDEYAAESKALPAEFLKSLRAYRLNIKGRNKEFDKYMLTIIGRLRTDFNLM